MTDRPGGRAARSVNEDAPAIGAIALTGPSIDFAPAQAAGAPSPRSRIPPSAAGGNERRRTRFRESSRLSRFRAGNGPPARPPAAPRDPFREPTPPAWFPIVRRSPASTDQTKRSPRDLSNMIELVKEPEAEISLVEGQTKIIQSRRELTRIVIANPLIADVELLTDQPGSRLLNLYGKSFGTTSLTMWDQTNRPVSFLVRVSLDTKDLESRIRQAFPGRRRQGPPGGPADHPGWPGTRLENDVGHHPARDVHAHEQPVARGAAGGGMGGGGWRRWMGGGGWAAAAWAAAAWAAGGGVAAGEGDDAHQSHHRPGTAAGLAARQDRRNQSKRHPQHRRELALRSRQFDFRLGCRAITRRDQHDDQRGLHANHGPLRALSSPSREPSAATGTAAPGREHAAVWRVRRAATFRLFIDALRIQQPGEDPRRAQPGRPRRATRRGSWSAGMFPFPVPQSSSIPGGTAVVTVQFQRFGTILTFLPQILAQRRDPTRRRAGHQRAQLRPDDDRSARRHGPVDHRAKRPTVVELREGQTLAIAGLLQIDDQRHDRPRPRAGRPADRGPMVQRQQHRDHRDRDHRAGDARAGLAAREERGHRSARRPGLPAQ